MSMSGTLYKYTELFQYAKHNIDYIDQYIKKLQMLAMRGLVATAERTK